MTIRQLASLVHLLDERASKTPERLAYRFVSLGSPPIEITYAELRNRVAALGAYLAEGHAPGSRALILCPPGIDFIVAFFGCLYGNVIAVPAYPPSAPAPGDPLVQRLRGVAVDSGATVILTLRPIMEAAPIFMPAMPEFATLEWVAVDDPLPAAPDTRRSEISGETIAFLQYTSGSTSTPRGVMVTHSNLLHNMEAICSPSAAGLTSDDRVASWLPPYHDMGLIGTILTPVFAHCPSTLMSPIEFLRHPRLWIEAISQYQITGTAAPNFAYDLCARRIPDDLARTFDLRAWRVALNGAERVRPETIDRFVRRFEAAGFKRSAFSPCYGLAESTLMVTCFNAAGSAPRTGKFKIDASGTVTPLAASAPDGPTMVALVSCGEPQLAEVCIVDPETRRALPELRTGEIWVRSESVAPGYWNKADETRQTFEAILVDPSSTTAGSRRYLRTGDLGFLHGGELWVTTRLKDIIVAHGIKVHCEDVEWTAERCHPSIRPGRAVAICLQGGGEDVLVVAVEVERRRQPDSDAPGRERRRTTADADPGHDPDAVPAFEPNEIVAAIRRQVSARHGLDIDRIVVLKPGSLPKTPSGKLQRFRCRELVTSGAANQILDWRRDDHK